MFDNNRPHLMFIGADSSLKANLQLIFTKLNVKVDHCDALQAIGRLLQLSRYDMIIWRCAARTRLNQKILLSLSEIHKKKYTNILVLCPPEMIKEMQSVGFKQTLSIPFKGMAFYQQIKSMLKVPDLMPAKYARLLEAQQFFNNISNDTLVMLMHFGAFKEFKAGQMITDDGDEHNHSLFLLVQGKVEIKLPQKNNQVVYVMEPGSCFGESSLFTDHSLHINVMAQQDCTVFVLPIESVAKLEDQQQLEIYKEITVTLSNKISRFAQSLIEK